MSDMDVYKAIIPLDFADFGLSSDISGTNRYKAITPLDCVADGTYYSPTATVRFDKNTVTWDVTASNYTINDQYSDDELILMDNITLSYTSNLTNSSSAIKPNGTINYTVTLLNGTSHQIRRYCKVNFQFTLAGNALGSLVINGQVKTPWNTSTAKRLTINYSSSDGVISPQMINTPVFDVDWTDLTSMSINASIRGGLGTS